MLNMSCDVLFYLFCCVLYAFEVYTPQINIVLNKIEKKKKGSSH